MGADEASAFGKPCIMLPSIDIAAYNEPSGKGRQNMKPVVLTLTFVLITARLEGSEERPSTDTAQSATEAEFRTAVENVEQLARGLQAGVKLYSNDLHTAMQRKGYGPHHPLFRTKVDGFEQDQIDLDSLDQFKMGRFAFGLQSSGVLLEPDPFTAWAEVQMWLDSFTAVMDPARKVVARTSLVAANTSQSVPLETFRALSKRWRAAVQQVVDAYEHAMAVRAVEIREGAMIPVEATVRMLGGGRYAVICAFRICTSQPTNSNGEVQRVPMVH